MFNTFVNFAFYSALCFAASAMVVRFMPNSVAARIIRIRLAAMLALPMLVLLDVMAFGGRLCSSAARGLRRLFEMLSGRKLRSRSSAYFGYESRPARRGRRT